VADDNITIFSFANRELAFTSVLGAFFVDGTFNKVGQFQGRNVFLLLLNKSFSFRISEKLCVIVFDDFVEISYLLIHLVLVR
jgi:hypothetical protein